MLGTYSASSKALGISTTGSNSNKSKVNDQFVMLEGTSPPSIHYKISFT